MIRATFTTRRTRELGFDTESRPSGFWFGDKTTARITAFAWKWNDESDVRSMLLRADGRWETGGYHSQPSDVAHLAFRRELARSDLVYGHNIRTHDLPLIQAGMMRLQLEPLPELRTTDTLRDLPKRKDMSASLENLAVSLELDGEKLHMSVADWEQANELQPAGINLARERVVSDVLLQERLHDRLRELGWLANPSIWKPRRR